MGRLRSFASHPTEGVRHGGWDGRTFVEAGSTYVPQGEAGWEIGSQRSNINQKATEDYKKRTENPDPIDATNATYVFVTPRQWPKKDEWAKARREDGAWKDVRVYDANQSRTGSNKLRLLACGSLRGWRSDLKVRFNSKKSGRSGRCAKMASTEDLVCDRTRTRLRDIVGSEEPSVLDSVDDCRRKMAPSLTQPSGCFRETWRIAIAPGRLWSRVPPLQEI